MLFLQTSHQIGLLQKACLAPSVPLPYYGSQMNSCQSLNMWGNLILYFNLQICEQK